MLKRCIEISLTRFYRFITQSQRFYQNDRGVSLVQTMIALGLVSVVTIGLLRNQQTMVRMQTNSDIGTDINISINRLTQTLFESTGCTNTFRPLGSISTGTKVLEVLNRSNNAIVDLTNGAHILNRGKVRIDSLEVTKYDASPIVAPSTTAHADLELTITFAKKDKPQGEWRNIIKVIPLSAAIDSSDRIQVCYDADSGIIDTALEQSCETMDFDDDGVYDFEWDRNLRKCIPISSMCIDGGSYIQEKAGLGDLGPTEGINPTTGTRGCPTDFTAYKLGKQVVVTNKTVTGTTSKERNHTHTYNYNDVDSGYHQIWMCLKCTSP